MKVHVDDELARRVVARRVEQTHVPIEPSGQAVRVLADAVAAIPAGKSMSDAEARSVLVVVYAAERRAQVQDKVTR